MGDDPGYSPGVTTTACFYLVDMLVSGQVFVGYQV
jgi:hypothetical protein